MSSRAKTMLVLSCVFITIALLILAYDAYMSFSTLFLLLGTPAENLGEALGKVFGSVILYAMTILTSIGVILFSGLTIPFDVILLKENGKKWYSITILVVAIVAIFMAIACVAMLPVISGIESSANSSSSSSDIATSEALLLL